MRNRLIFAMVAVVALILAVHDIPLARHLERVERDRLVTQYERDAFIIGGLSEEALDDGNAQDSPGLAATVANYAEAKGVEVVIADETGAAVVISDRSKAGLDMTNRPEFADVLASRNPVIGERYSQTLATNLFFVSVPVVSGENVVGVVRVSAPSDAVASRVQAQIRGLILVALISLAIAVVVAWLVATGFTRPVIALRRATDRFAAGDLSARAPTAVGAAEVGELSESFNAMANRIEDLIDRQQRFAGDASHQLRTPLTALRLQLEQLQERNANDPATAAALDDAVGETDRLRTMVEGLLALSRADSASAPAVVVDVANAARDRVDHWEPLAAENGVQLTFDGPQRATARAAPESVTQIVDNLIDNALGVAPAGSTVRVVVEPDGEQLRLRVIDEGPGMTSAERERAFERFWRARDASPGGTGLGLAIVQQLVDASGGSCGLAASPSGGIDATVTLRRPRTEG